MICNSCTGPMLQVYGQTHFHCVSCNAFGFTDDSLAIEKIEPLGKETDFQCPKCNQALAVGLLHESVQVCFCENCLGYVIDNQSFGALAMELRRQYTGPDDAPKPIDPRQLDDCEPCPACLETMQVHPYYGPGSIVIDTCMHCQLAWLDHGELSRIVRAPGPRK